MRELAAAGLAIGDSGAAPMAALRRLVTDPDAGALRDTLAIAPTTRALLIATEGPTDPQHYARIVDSVDV
jgi:diaminopropionate ammonia-lyase